MSYTVGWKEGFKPLRRKGHSGSPAGIKVQILHLGLKGGTHGPSGLATGGLATAGGAEKQQRQAAAAGGGSLESPIHIGFHVGGSRRDGAGDG